MENFGFRLQELVKVSQNLYFFEFYMLYLLWLSGKEEDKMDKTTKTISKDLTWKGLRMELSSEELQSIFQQEYEEDEYYDYNVLITGLYKALKKEIDFEYFKDWCVLIANCFNHTSYKKEKMKKLMWNISYFFDGISFEEDYDENTLLQDIATMKDYNFDFENNSKKRRPPFETNGIERILTFDHCNRAEDSSVYRVIIKDNIKKQFDLKFLDNAFYVFDDNINYTFVTEKEFEKIFNSFFENDDEWIENHDLKF